MGRLSGWCQEAVWMVWDGCLEGVGRLFLGCMVAVFRVWEGCLEHVVRVSV